MVVNHARFLAFPDRERLPYLASRDFYREHGKHRQLFPRPPRHPPRPCTCGRTRTACAARPEPPLGRAKVACDVRRRVAIIGRWLSEQEPAAIARLALDGKTPRGSGRRDGKALRNISAGTQHLPMTPQELPIEEKTNGIPGFKPLRRTVKPPPGTLVTAVAMHCQQESRRAWWRSSETDLFGLKGNQDGILSRAERRLAQGAFSPLWRTRSGKSSMTGWSVGGSRGWT